MGEKERNNLEKARIIRLLLLFQEIRHQKKIVGIHDYGITTDRANVQVPLWRLLIKYTFPLATPKVNGAGKGEAHRATNY